MDSIESYEREAGPDQTIVVYRPRDDGRELDPVAIFGAIAEDASRRAAAGEWIVSTAVMQLRHAGAAFSEASGYQTKTAVAAAITGITMAASSSVPTATGCASTPVIATEQA